MIWYDISINLIWCIRIKLLFYSSLVHFFIIFYFLFFYFCFYTLILFYYYFSLEFRSSRAHSLFILTLHQVDTKNNISYPYLSNFQLLESNIDSRYWKYPLPYCFPHFITQYSIFLLFDYFLNFYLLLQTILFFYFNTLCSAFFILWHSLSTFYLYTSVWSDLIWSDLVHTILSSSLLPFLLLLYFAWLSSLFSFE